MLLDEPFSRLDAITKASMQDWYLAIKDKYALTTILFTHHIDEALRMSYVIHVLSPKKKSIAYTHRIPEGDRKEFELSRDYLDAKKAIQ